MKKLNPFKPTDIGGCQLWLDFADITSLFQNTAGTIPVTSDSQNIQYIKDKSIAGNNASTTATGMIYRATANGGLPSVYFPGTQALGYTMNLAFGVSDATYFFVVNNQRTDGSISVYFAHVGSSRTKQFWWNTNVLQLDVGGIIGISGSTNVNQLTTIVSCTEVASTSILNGWQNGNPFSVTDKNMSGTLNTSFNSGVLGTDNGPFPITGYVSEVIIYNQILNSTDRPKVEGYLAQKWGLVSTLPANNPGRTQVIYPHNLQVYGLATGQATLKPYIIPKKILVLVGGVSVFSYLPLATNSTDVGGTPQTVTTNGTVTYTTIASKQCAYFSNSLSNYLSVTYVPQTQITLCFWLYVIDSGTYTAVSINDGALNPTLQITPVGGNFFYAHTAMPNQWTNVPQGSYPGPGQWVHFAITVNYATYFEEVYVNGTSVSTATGTGPPTIPQTNIWLGRSGDAARAYYGYIRQFCTFPSILTQAQIQSVITFTT